MCLYAYGLRVVVESFSQERTIMLQGLYLATQGMTTLMQKQDQISNNLANVNTTGYKQSNLFVESLSRHLVDNEQEPFVNRQIKADGVYTDYSEGQLRKTGNPLDCAIKGSGFFSVMTPDNGVAYTRNGNFSMNADGFLVTANGSRVLGENGYIRFTGKEDIDIREKGQVYQGDEQLDRLRIADFKKPYALIKTGANNFKPEDPAEKLIPSPGFALQQGYLEKSNVDMIRNMVDMIASFRNFEADQKALSAQDQTLDKAVNQVGRVQ
jgi:flagellar basal-body rod protein FlgG